MGIMENINERAKKLSIFDIKLAQGAAMFVALMFAKLIPRIMEVSIGWFVALSVICAMKPSYVFFIRR